MAKHLGVFEVQRNVCYALSSIATGVPFERLADGRQGPHRRYPARYGETLRRVGGVEECMLRLRLDRKRRPFECCRALRASSRAQMARVMTHNTVTPQSSTPPGAAAAAVRRCEALPSTCDDVQCCNTPVKCAAWSSGHGGKLLLRTVGSIDCIDGARDDAHCRYTPVMCAAGSSCSGGKEPLSTVINIARTATQVSLVFRPPQWDTRDGSGSRPTLASP